MADFGSISFHSSRASGILISEFGSGVADTIAWYGSQGVSSAVEIATFQDTTFITDESGTIVPHLGATSGQLMNVKYISDTVVQVSGAPSQTVATYNVFDVDNLVAEPTFNQQTSGTLLIRYFASGTSAVNTYNANIFAYNPTVGFTEPPEDMTVYGVETNASGIWFNNAHEDNWKTMQGSNDAYFFANHSPTNGYQPANEHIWVIGLSARPNSVGTLNNVRLGFSLQFA